jgi:hypothetical protein
MPPRGLDPSGIILVDKPAGPTSFDIVAAVRRRTGARTGHAGTLDPFATGLLLLLSGAATGSNPLRRPRQALPLRSADRADTPGPRGGGRGRDAPSAPIGLLDSLRGAVELPIPAASA